ncbi:Scr1 family TA system antitoxin-like transcriptional regulator [Streptomyces sp. NPDC017260]|uniref:Scr1 family TA system antitoxin-like transcriptional regulator n=1 Tax=unclassified Streptomyces TaxID=2593676 RepID=UPI00379CC680
MTRSHIAHIEAGRRVPSKEDARRLDTALNTGDVLSSFLPEEEAAVADYFEAARLLESQAVAIRESAVTFFPGLLQTRPYARAVIGTTYPPLTDEQCDRRLVTRLERAKILDDPITPAFRGLLDDALLYRCIQVAKVHDSPAVVERLQGACYHALSDALSLRESLALLKSSAKDYEDTA